jgi:indolepyruvate ferredoxin oxidoreductase, beta subunit
MYDKSVNVYVCGVGGFGIGSVTKILTVAAELSNMKAIGSETHGLAQRGGVVISTLRIGPDVSGSPLIMKGRADIVIALEPLEALRALPFLKKDGTIIYNTQIFQPLSVRIGLANYPDSRVIRSELEKVTQNVIPVDAGAKAKELGLSESANVIILGVLTRRGALPFDLDTMRTAVLRSTPAKYSEINSRALEVA